QGTLVFDVMLPLFDSQRAFPMKTLSDTEAITIGVGRSGGESVSVVEVDGEEYLFYLGYLMEKK
ncbi:MAG: serine hydrolase, partial [Chloroflexi bacterium]|nr:serine hydrolase [Chloroflexota bacterium]